MKVMFNCYRTIFIAFAFFLSKVVSRIPRVLLSTNPDSPVLTQLIPNPPRLLTKNRHHRNPTNKPFASPTRKPKSVPKHPPSTSSTRKPSPLPTHAPTTSPTRKPSPLPTGPPSISPTRKPSPLPTGQPTTSPTRKPSPVPTGPPSTSPALKPSPLPTPFPTGAPTRTPPCPASCSTDVVFTFDLTGSQSGIFDASCLSTSAPLDINQCTLATVNANFFRISIEAVCTATVSLSGATFTPSFYVLGVRGGDEDKCPGIGSCQPSRTPFQQGGTTVTWKSDQYTYQDILMIPVAGSGPLSTYNLTVSCV